jgi:hypothetical protein
MLAGDYASFTVGDVFEGARESERELKNGNRGLWSGLTGRYTSDVEGAQATNDSQGLHYILKTKK